MKRLLIYLIFWIFTLGCKSNKIPKLNLKEEIAKRNIQFLKSYEYLYKFGKLDSATKFLTTFQELDNKGNVILEINYKRPDSISYLADTSTFKINEKGNVLEIKKTEHLIDAYNLKSVATVNRTVNKFDNDNNRIETSLFRGGELRFKLLFTYENGKNIRNVSYDKTGAINGRSEFVYNGNILVSSVDYDSSNKIVSRNKSMRNGDIVEENSYNEKDSLDAVLKMKLNTRDDVVESIYISGDYYSKSIYEYNNWGFLVSKTIFNIPTEPYLKLEFVVEEFKKKSISKSN